MHFMGAGISQRWNIPCDVLSWVPPGPRSNALLCLEIPICQLGLLRRRLLFLAKPGKTFVGVAVEGRGWSGKGIGVQLQLSRYNA